MFGLKIEMNKSYNLCNVNDNPSLRSIDSSSELQMQLSFLFNFARKIQINNVEKARDLLLRRICFIGLLSLIIISEYLIQFVFGLA